MENAIWDSLRAELARVRAAEPGWPDLAFVEVTDADGDPTDGHLVARARVIWALQLDRTHEDRELVRFLLEQEVRCGAAAAFQGCTEELRLAALYVAEHRDPRDVWLLWRAKTANFDTWCGFDIELLFAGGVRATLDLVRTSNHPDRDAILERVLDDTADPCVTDDEVIELMGRTQSWFPRDPRAQPPMLWFDRALTGGDVPLARRLLEKWAGDQPRDADTLASLSYHLQRLGDLAAAARAQRDLIDHVDRCGDQADDPDGDFDRASRWLRLAELQREAGDAAAAWASLRACERALSHVDGWREVGLGRSFVGELFLVAAATPDDAYARDVWRAAHRHSGTVDGLSLVTLRAAVAAAERLGGPELVTHYRRLRDAEERQINESIARLRAR